MKFADVQRDIHKLIGLELNSINHGATITIDDIDDEHNRIIIKTKNGKLRSRPMNEIKKIWDEMQKESAVHVDRVLNGSGTSRNQPETILANLPYIEWLRIDHKKHIAYVGESTHPFGTLQEMESIKAVELTDKLRLTNKKATLMIVIVSKDINADISYIQKFFSGKLSALEQGIYQIETNDEIIVFVSSEATGIEEGTYCVVESNNHNPGTAQKKISLYGNVYSVFCNGDIKMLLKE